MHLVAPSVFTFFFAFAAIPVVLYLIFRRKRKDVPWGATYILRRMLETKSKLSAWKQYIIIATRTLAFVALPLFFMKPHRVWAPPANAAFPQPPSSTHRCLLVDVSESMDAAHGSGSCLDSAISLCRKAIESGVFPGRIDIIPLDGRTEPFTFEPPVKQDSIEKFVVGIERQTPKLEMEQGLRSALKLFRASHYERKELYVLSDLSATGLSSMESLAGLFKAVRGLGVTIHTLSYENPEANNFALLDFGPDMDLLLAGQPTIFYVTVGYYGAQATGDAWLTIRDRNDDALYEEAICLAPGVKTLEIPLALSAGEQVLTVELNEDDFTADNRLSRSFRVSDQLRLLVAQDINLTPGFANPREWLKLALAGRGSGKVISAQLEAMLERGKALQAQLGKNVVEEDEVEKTEDDPMYKTVVDYVNASQLGPDVLKDRDGIILLDVDTLAEDAVQALKKYASRGGTVFLAPGPNADPARFNETFGDISPCILSAPVRTKVDPDIYDSAVLDRASDLLLRELESPKHGRIGNPRFYNHYQVAIADAREHDVHTVFSLAGGSPLLIERAMGRGVCLLWTAGLGMDWNSMIVHPIYPVFFSRMFNMGADRRRFALNLIKGDPIIRHVDVGQVTIERPNGEKLSIATTSSGGGRILRYDDTDLAGTYTVHVSKDPEVPVLQYNVREDRAESDYRPIGPEARKQFEKLIASEVTHQEPELFQQVGSAYDGSPLMAWCALALLMCFLLEAGLARKWFT